MWLSVVELIVSGWLTLAYFGQQHEPQAVGSAPQLPAGAIVPGLADVEVTSEETEVYDRPDETSYVVATLRRGNRIGVRYATAGNWLAIDPPPATICWIERSAMDPDAKPVGRNDLGTGSGASGERAGERATVVVADAVVRFGQSGARLPGPPAGRLMQGTILRLLDRPPLTVGQGRTARTWCAIEPPPDQACYVRAAITSSPARMLQPMLAETQAAYANTRGSAPTDEKPRAENLPPGIASELERIEAAHRSTILKGQPIEQWRLEPVRARYQALLKAARDSPAAEEAIRVRLSQVTQQEQAAMAARTLATMLAESHRRDGEVAEVRKRIAAAARTHARAYQAVGFIQPSAQNADGRKLYVLIGATGKTVAYLDIPPGLDPNPLLSQRVGVRGSPHYSEDLGTRLITVRALESLEARK
jgi:hypothetical protein